MTSEDHAVGQDTLGPEASCSRCGEPLEVDATFCNGCGTRVEAHEAGAPVASAEKVRQPGAGSAEDRETESPVTTDGPGRSRALPVAILVVVVVAVLVLVGLALTRSNRQPPRQGDVGVTATTAPPVTAS